MTLLSRTAAIVVAAIGCGVLAGWAFHVEMLASLLPAFGTMQPNSALCFVLAGAALWLWHYAVDQSAGGRRASAAYRLGAVLAVIVLLVGVLTLAEQLLGADFGIDRLLFADGAGMVAQPGRMAPPTAATFAVLGLALVCSMLSSNLAASLAQWGASAVMTVSAVSTLGYLFGAQLPDPDPAYLAIAAQTATSFLVLGAGVLTARPADGWFRELAADTASARMGRRLLLSVCALLPLLAWLRLFGQARGWYGTEVGVGMLVVGSIAMMAMLIWLNTRRANIAEARIVYLNRVYAMLSEINALIVRVRDRDELFAQACAIAVETGGFPCAWFGLVDERTQRIVPVASAGAARGMPEHTEAKLSIAPDRPHYSPAAEAVLTMRAVVGNDVVAELQDPYREDFLARGIRSFAVLPLVTDGRTLGIFKLHAEVPGFFSDEELRLLREMAGDMVFVLDHMHKEQTLHYLAYFDALTGLANASLLRDRLRQQLITAARGRERLALIIVDIRHFKMINDSFGRHVGDAILKQLAQRLEHSVDANRVGRVGSNHFAVILPRVASESEVVHCYEQLMRHCFEMPFGFDDQAIRLAARAGIALYPDDGPDENALLSNAEEALKAVRAEGETFLFHRRRLNEQVAERLHFEMALREAVELECFVLHYQPKVDASSRAICGAEALLRWRTTRGGLIAPNRFVPLLEELGLIRRVGAWALQQARADSLHLDALDAPDLRIAVNVSGVQLRQVDFVETVAGALAINDASIGLDLEITESLAMTNVSENTARLREIRKLGVRVAIDDFGTGYSSLSQLARLPADYLKIDRAFVVGLPTDTHAATLVASVISLAHSLELKVIAEGVETEAQAHALRDLGCDELQGYLFGKPLPLDDFVRMVEAA